MNCPLYLLIRYIIYYYLSLHNLQSYTLIIKTLKYPVNFIFYCINDVILGENDKINGFNYTLFLQAVETKIIYLFEICNIPRSNLALILAARGKRLSKTGESQKSYRKSPDGIEDKKTITIPCQM